MLPKNMGWGSGKGKLLDPEMRVEGPRRATGAAYLKARLLAALRNQWMDPTP